MNSQKSTLAESWSTHDLKKQHGRASWKKISTFALVVVVKLANFHFTAKNSLCRKTIAHRMVRTAATSPGKLIQARMFATMPFLAGAEVFVVDS